MSKVEKTAAGYVTPDQGPFECDRCEHYGGTASQGGPCELVAGTVQPKGCCNLWKLRAGVLRFQASQESGESY